jgi:hypothetical protein
VPAESAQGGETAAVAQCVEEFASAEDICHKSDVDSTRIGGWTGIIFYYARDDVSKQVD